MTRLAARRPRWRQPRELLIAAGLLTVGVVVALALSVLVGAVQGTDYALSEMRELAEPTLTISALSHDHSRAGWETVEQTISSVRADLGDLEHAIRPILGDADPQAIPRLNGRLDAVRDAARADDGVAPDTAQLSRLLVEYHSDVMTLSAELTTRHMAAMRRLDLALRAGVVAIGVSAVVAGLMIAKSALRDAQSKLDQARQDAVEIAAIADAASVAIIVADQTGRVVSANTVADASFGYAPGSLVGRRIAEALPDMAAITTPAPFTAEIQAVRADGERFPAELRLAAAPSVNGRARLVYVVQDLSDRQRAESERMVFQERMLIAQRNDALATLVAGVAHDFNNLITAIRASVEMAQRHPGEGAAWLDHAIVASDRSSTLVRQLLEFARPTPPEDIDVDLARLVSECVELARATFDRRIEIVWLPPAQATIVRGDRSQLHQVLMNLLVNARDAVTERLMQGEGAYQPRICAIASHRSRGAAMLEVRDNGAGICPSIRTRIFDPFFTTKETGKGTGLGLSTSARIVALHQGQIDLHSVVGSGTSFTVTLPAASDPRRPERDRPSPAEQARPIRDGRGRILVADDEPTIRAFASAILREIGYEVVTVPDGLAAVHEGAAGAFDLFVIDGNMPRLSGWEAARQLQDLAPDTPTVIITGYVDDARLPSHGVTVLQKPFGLARLREVVDAAIATRQAARSAAAPSVVS